MGKDNRVEGVDKSAEVRNNACACVHTKRSRPTHKQIIAIIIMYTENSCYSLIVFVGVRLCVARWKQLAIQFEHER